MAKRKIRARHRYGMKRGRKNKRGAAMRRWHRGQWSWRFAVAPGALS